MSACLRHTEVMAVLTTKVYAYICGSLPQHKLLGFNFKHFKTCQVSFIYIAHNKYNTSYIFPQEALSRT